MSPQALHLTPADIPSSAQYLVFSPERGLISDHCTQEEAKAFFASYVSDFELGEYIPFILRRAGEEWEIEED